MRQALASSAEINRQFAEQTMTRAAEIVMYDQPFGQPDAVDALLRAKNELLAAEPADQKARRTYGGAEIIPDFGQYIASRYPEFTPPGGFRTVIGPWCRSQTSQEVAETLRLASQPIGAAIARRTAIVEQRQCLNDRELDELATLDQLSEFLAGQGIAADLGWRKPGEAQPAEFHGLINEEPWTFAVTQFAGIGPWFVPNREQTDTPVQSALDIAARQASKARFLGSTTGARQCLVIHNWGFTDPSQWAGVRLPVPQFDAVAVLHNDDVTATQVWQIQPAHSFGPAVPSLTILDLNKEVQRKLDKNPNINPERLRRAWAVIADSGLNEADILRIAKQD